MPIKVFVFSSLQSRPSETGNKLIEIEAQPNRPLASENPDFSCPPLFEKV